MTHDDVASIYHTPVLDLILRAAEVHREHWSGSEVQVCVLLSVKTGGCPEDCGYCPQAARYHTGVSAQPLMDVENVMASARNAKSQGATRFCMGAAWREVKDGPQFDRILEMIRGVKSLGLEACCTLGMVSEDQARRMAEAGLDAYNHNLDTSRDHYGEIISTRTYEDRLRTIGRVRDAGITVCSGGIVGLGETDDDRIAMLHTLATLPEPPESVPINALVAVEGTPLADQPPVAIWDMVRTIATARILMPRSMVRLSAGRVSMSEAEQALCFLAGANSIFAGDKLLTTPNPGPRPRLRVVRTPRIAPDALSSRRIMPNTGMIPRRVVVTGVGLVSGLGPDAETTWRGMKEGRSAARWLVDPFGDGGPALVGCPRIQSSRAIVDASIEADRDASLGPDQVDLGRVGVVIGFSKGDVRGLADSRLHPGRHRRPWSNWPGGPAGELAELRDYRGPSLAPIAACATGVVSILRAADLIRRGTCDVVLAGAGDTQLEPFCLAAFRKIHVLADVGDEPTAAARPWNRDRSGFVVGEGAAILVLEGAEHARSRGILPYAEVAGGAMGSDAYHITDLNPDPTNLADLIGRALENADSSTSDVDHVNVHGTGTRVGDPLECRAIRRAFGKYADSLSCTANKSQIGHLLGAAGAAEAAITCLSIRDGFVPPTLNLTDPDPACDLDGTPIVGRKREIRAALKLSIGFGGHLAAVVFRRPDGPRRGPGDG